MLLEDETTESKPIEEWDDVRNKIAQFRKRKEWLGNTEETKEPESLHKPEEQPWPSETSADRPANLTVME